MTIKTQNALRLQTASEEASLELGGIIGTALLQSMSLNRTGGVTILLSGDLGTGKTTLVRGIGDVLGITRVKSPSFTLINEYRAADFLVAHADLYRLEAGMGEDLGLDEYYDTSCILLIEWPERCEKLIERDALKIFIESVSENERHFEISSKGEAADSLLKNMREAVTNGKTDSGVGLQLALD